MTELSTTKLDPDAHLLLDQPLLRLPHELLKKNFKSALRQLEITKSLTASAQAALAQDTGDALASLDATLLKAQNLKRKLEAFQVEEKTFHRQQKERIQHLQRLHEVPSLADPRYDSWAHTRFDRLLVDYLLRQGYTESARVLAQDKGINELVDVNVFEECGKIERSLRAGRIQECLAWCIENKQALRKINSNLELELRLQQFIELARTGDLKQLMEAIVHARKYLAGGTDVEFGLRAGGLLAYPPDTPIEPYRTMYSGDRYNELALQFLRTHHELFALPSQPLLHIALSAGLSALKTPTCYATHAAHPATRTGAVCPICSHELNELARNVPFAHHTTSLMEEDSVMLPNGRVFGRARLEALNEKLGTKKGRVRDPTEPQGPEWGDWELKRVYIS